MSFKLVLREVCEGLKRLYGVEGKSLGSLARINNLAYYPARCLSPVARVAALLTVWQIMYRERRLSTIFAFLNQVYNGEQSTLAFLYLICRKKS